MLIAFVGGIFLDISHDFHLNVGLFEDLIYWKVWASLTAKGVLLSSCYNDS